MPDFKKLFIEHPELLTFLAEGVEATQDYDVDTMLPWMLEMYEAAGIALAEIMPTLSGKPIERLLLCANPKIRSIELERTVLCIMTMEAVAVGDYTFFVETPVLFGEPISAEQFDRLRELMCTFFPDKSDKLLRFELLLGDIGKVRPLREALSAEFGIEEQDPDQFMERLLSADYAKLIEWLPGLSQLAEAEFLELRKINTGFHFGHFAHAESTESALEKLRNTLHSHGFDYLFRHILVQIFDVAGAAAQAGKVLLNSDILRLYLDDILSMLQALESKAPEVVYDYYLKRRLAKCEVIFTADAPLNPAQKLLARMLCMFRILSADKAAPLLIAFDHLKENDAFRRHVRWLDEYQASPKTKTPTYMPALINALKDNPRIMELAERGEEPTSVALRVGIRLIAGALWMHQQLLAGEFISGANPVNFNALTGLVKSDFDAVKYLVLEEDFAFDVRTGSVASARWVEKTHGSLEGYTNSEGALRKEKQRQAALVIQRWYRRDRSGDSVALENSI